MIYELIRESITGDLDAVVFIGTVETADRILDMLKKWIPVAVPDEILMAIAGWAMIKYGDRVHRIIKPVGAGMLVRAIGAYVGGIFETVLTSATQTITR